MSYNQSQMTPYIASQSLLQDVYITLGPNPSPISLATTILDLQYQHIIPVGKEMARSFLKQFRSFVRGEKWIPDTVDFTSPPAHVIHCI